METTCHTPAVVTTWASQTEYVVQRYMIEQAVQVLGRHDKIAALRLIRQVWNCSLNEGLVLYGLISNDDWNGRVGVARDWVFAREGA